MSERKKYIIGAVAILLLCSSAIALYIALREDPQMQKVRDLSKNMREMKDVPRDERREKFQELKVEMDKLTDEQRQSLREEQFKEFENRMMDHIDKYFKLPEGEERVAFLDKEIDQGEAMRKRFEEMRANGGFAFGGGGGGPPWARRGNRGEKPQAEGEAEKPENKPEAKPESKPRVSREQRVLKWLDNHTPEQRAKMYEYRKAINERRKERGLPESRFGGFPGGGFPGGGRGPGGGAPGGGGPRPPQG